MSTPFDTIVPATVVPATDAQIQRAIRPMLDDRDWTADANSKFVMRVAALKLAIRWSLEPMADSTPPEVSRIMGRGSSYGERVNQIMAHMTANGQHEAGCEFVWAPLSKSGASKLITYLGNLEFRSNVSIVEEANVEAAKAANVTVADDEVPAGRYAVATDAGAVNELAFYKVDRPTTGKWAGFVFVKHIVGDDEQRMSKAAGASILAKIAAVGAEAASAAYGHEIGECGVCGRQLTNDASRERGIGPICVAKMGW